MDHGVNSVTEAVEDATNGVQMRYPNVTINQSQVRYEQNLRLKASRSAVKGIITRRRNEAREMMSDFGNPYDIEQKLVELDEAITGFEAAHQAYRIIINWIIETTSRIHLNTTKLPCFLPAILKELSRIGYRNLNNRREQLIHRSWTLGTQLATLALELHQRFCKNLRPVLEQALNRLDKVQSVVLG